MTTRPRPRRWWSGWTPTGSNSPTEPTGSIQHIANAANEPSGASTTTSRSNA